MTIPLADKEIVTRLVLYRVDRTGEYCLHALCVGSDLVSREAQVVEEGFWADFTQPNPILAPPPRWAGDDGHPV